MTVAAKQVASQTHLRVVPDLHQATEVSRQTATCQVTSLRNNTVDSYVFAIAGSAGLERPIIKDENLIHNQRQELALAAEVTLKTVEWFLADHPDPFAAPAQELTQLTNYLNAGMSLPYAARVDFGPYYNYKSPQPDVVFPPTRGGSYKLDKGDLLIADTQGGYVPLKTVIACLRSN